MEKSKNYLLKDQSSFDQNKKYFSKHPIQPSLHLTNSPQYKTVYQAGKHVKIESQPNLEKQLLFSSSHEVSQNVARSDYLQTSMDETAMAITREGLQHPRALLFLLLWYLFSAGTLFLNKYILSYQKFDPYLLCGLQMFTTMVCGAVQLRYPLGCYTPSKPQTRPSNFFQRMALLGVLQLGTIFFGLVALYYVAVSFAETVKSTAPIVTVVMSFLLRGERTGLMVLVSLLPVMGGLALCSSGELSFSTVGLLCALTTNICEVVQSVVSKTVLSDTAYKYNPAELQVYPNLCGVVIQVFAWLVLVPWSALERLFEPQLALLMLLDGICFHGQTITAYVLMTYVSPVTYSVANTTKRAVLIWLSVLVFGNPVTAMSGLGTLMVLGGVMLYSKAKERDQRLRIQFSMPDQSMKHYN